MRHRLSKGRSVNGNPDGCIRGNQNKWISKCSQSIKHKTFSLKNIPDSFYVPAERNLTQSILNSTWTGRQKQVFTDFSNTHLFIDSPSDHWRRTCGIRQYAILCKSNNGGFSENHFLTFCPWFWTCSVRFLVSWSTVIKRKMTVETANQKTDYQSVMLNFIFKLCLRLYEQTEKFLLPDRTEISSDNKTVLCAAQTRYLNS